MTLLRYGRQVPTIFDLLGAKENDMTASLAYVLAHSPCFLRSFVSNLTGRSCKSVDDAILRIQTSRRDEGITDIEIDLGDRFFAIVEAKQGPILPSRSQLSLYAPIIQRHDASSSFLVTISNATKEFAKIKLTPPTVADIPVVHRSWRNMKHMAEGARDFETHTNKRLLNQFSTYLEGLLGLENKYSNLVYVVSLAHGNPTGWTLSWIDIVEKRRRYFFPVGAAWPDPPNYLGFRYGGKLQSIHRVESFSVFENPAHGIPRGRRRRMGATLLFQPRRSNHSISRCSEWKPYSPRKSMLVYDRYAAHSTHNKRRANGNGETVQ